MDFSHIKNELLNDGWKDIHSGSFLDIDFDLIASKRHLFSNMSILFKYIPSFQQDMIEEWKSNFNYLCKNYRKSKQLFVLCLLTDDMPQASVNELLKDPFPLKNYLTRKGVAIVGDIKNKQIIGDLPLLPIDFHWTARLVKRLIHEVFLQHRTFCTESDLNAFHCNKKLSLSKPPKIWLAFLVIGFIVFLRICIVDILNMYHEYLTDILMNNSGPFDSNMSRIDDLLIYASAIRFLHDFSCFFLIIFELFTFHRIHKILNEKTNHTYIMSPGIMLLGFFIPFFNIYWLYKCPALFFDYMKNCSQTKYSGRTVGLFFLFSTFLASLNTLDIIGLLMIWVCLKYMTSLLTKETSLQTTASTKQNEYVVEYVNPTWKNSTYSV